MNPLEKLLIREKGTRQYKEMDLNEDDKNFFTITLLTGTPIDL